MIENMVKFIAAICVVVTLSAFLLASARASTDQPQVRALSATQILALESNQTV